MVTVASLLNGDGAEKEGASIPTPCEYVSDELKHNIILAFYPTPVAR